MEIFILLCFGAYILGSINFAIILLKILGKKDPRTEFSGNAGTVNVFRQIGIFGAALVLILDLGRAALISYLALQHLHLEQVPWIALLLITGNRFPLFHGFKGGKGVANYLGFTLVISPPFGAISAALWVISYGIVRITFIPSFVMVLTLAAGVTVKTGLHPAGITATAVTVSFIFFNHRKNIHDFLKKSKGKGT